MARAGRTSAARRAARRVRWLLSAVVIVSAAGALACGRARDRSGISDSLWVAAMARLEAIGRDSTLDSAAKVAARRKALQERGLSTEALERKARALASTPDRAVALLQRADSLARAPAADRGAPAAPAAPAAPKAKPRSAPPAAR